MDINFQPAISPSRVFGPGSFSSHITTQSAVPKKMRGKMRKGELWKRGEGSG